MYNKSEKGLWDTQWGSNMKQKNANFGSDWILYGFQRHDNISIKNKKTDRHSAIFWPYLTLFMTNISEHDWWKEHSPITNKNGFDNK